MNGEIPVITPMSKIHGEKSPFLFFRREKSTQVFVGKVRKIRSENGQISNGFMFSILIIRL